MEANGISEPDSGLFNFLGKARLSQTSDYLAHNHTHADLESAENTPKGNQCAQIENLNEIKQDQKESKLTSSGLEEYKVDVVVEQPEMSVSDEDREYILIKSKHPPQWKAILSNSGKQLALFDFG